MIRSFFSGKENRKIRIPFVSIIDLNSKTLVWYIRLNPLIKPFFTIINKKQH